MKRLLLIGGGHSHVEVLRRFGAQPAAGVDITLVSPERYTPYSGMLPGLVAGHYAFGDCHIDLERLTQFAGARFLQTAARGLAGARREVALADGSAAGYDIASFDVGSAPALAPVPGALDNAVAVRPVPAFLNAWDALIGRVRAGGLKRLAVVGGGAAGVEILLALQYRLAQAAGDQAPQCVLVCDTNCLLPDHNPRVQAAFERILSERQIQVCLASRVVRVAANEVIAENGRRIPAGAVIWATGAQAVPHLHGAGLERDARGFITVNEHLQSVSLPEVYAAGDCATIRDRIYPKSGVYAVRQGPPLAANLRRALAGLPLIAYRPQRRALALISTGDKRAVASYGPLAIEGALVWRWKDHIDRRFMARYEVPV